MPVDVSSYPKTQAPNFLETAGAFGKVNDALSGLMVGKAMQGAIDPQTGQVDTPSLLQNLIKTPAGARQAVPTLDALQKLKQAGYDTTQKGLETFQKRMATTYHLFSGLASKDTPTGDDVMNVAAQALNPAYEADKVGITVPVIMAAVNQFKDPKTKQWLPSAEIRKKALEIQTQAGTTAEILEQHSPRGEWIDRGGNLVYVPVGTRQNPATGTVVRKNLPPTTQVVGSGGETRLLGEQPAAPGAGVVSPNAPEKPGVTAPAGPGPATSLPPGQAEAMVGTAQEGARLANELTRSNDTSVGRKAILGNMETMLRDFESGKGADWTLFAKNFANRNLPVPDSWKQEGGILDPKSVKSQEEFNKLAVQLAQQQFSAIGGTGTDAKFSSAFETSPNELLSQLGNKGIISLLKGNEDAIQAKNRAWIAYRRKNGASADKFADFSADFNDHFDPRVFQFKYLDPKDRQAYIDGMSADEADKFLHDITYARKQGWVKFDTIRK